MSKRYWTHLAVVVFSFTIIHTPHTHSVAAAAAALPASHHHNNQITNQDNKANEKLLCKFNNCLIFFIISRTH